MHQQLLYPKEEARLAVGYKRRAWDYVIASGELPVIRHGNRVFVTAEVLSEFAKRDRPRMIPKAASHSSESTVTSPAVGNEEPNTRPTYQPTYPDSAERERLLKQRRRRALGGSSQ